MEKKKKKQIDIEIEFLPKGQVRITRGDCLHNRSILKIMKELLGKEKIKEIEKFLKGSENVKLLSGKRIYCG